MTWPCLNLWCIPRSTFSMTVASSMSLGDWNVREIPLLTRSVGLSSDRSLPSRNAAPRDAFTYPERTLKIVVFPAPLGPMSPLNPGTKLMSTPSRTLFPPNDTWRSSKESGKVDVSVFISNLHCLESSSEVLNPSAVSESIPAMRHLWGNQIATISAVPIRKNKSFCESWNS